MTDIFKETKRYDGSNVVKVRIPAQVDGSNIPVGDYILHLDYESDAEIGEAAQLTRRVIVGSGTKLHAIPIVRVPYTTTASSASGITAQEKLATSVSFNIVVRDKYTNELVPDFDVYAAFVKHDDTNYFIEENNNKDVLKEKYTNGVKLTGNPFTTNSNGKTTISFQLSDIFTTEEVNTIHDGDTLGQHSVVFYLRYTTDRTDKNYVSYYAACPVILGVIPVKTVVREIDHHDESNPLIGTVCPKGTVQIGVKLNYRFPYNYDPDNVFVNDVKEGYSSWTSAANTVNVGRYTVYESVNGGEYTQVPFSRLASAYVPTDTVVYFDGTIQPDTDGTTYFRVKNDYPVGTVVDNYKIRVVYTGKIGETRNLTVNTFTVKVSPEYESISRLATEIELYEEEEPIVMVAGNGKDVRLGVYLKDDDVRDIPITQGDLEYEVR